MKAVARKYGDNSLANERATLADQFNELSSKPWHVLQDDCHGGVSFIPCSQGTVLLNSDRNSNSEIRITAQFWGSAESFFL